MPFDLMKQETNDFKYTRLNDTSLTASSLLIVDPFDDQKLPINNNNALLVNETEVAGPKIDLFLVEQTNELGEQNSANGANSRSVPDQENSYETGYTSNNSSLIYHNYNQQQQTQPQPVNNNNRIQTRDLIPNGEDNNDDDTEITKDHIKYINLFSILCCWCFPITGLIGIFYAILTRKYYNKSDLRQAKKFLRKSEWCLILTFLFGMLIFILFLKKLPI